ncbi:MAG: right-handed parallel beta-helix repeat-containing protein, partial [Candidatus Thermoplasmatota archaeon]|nr:right-handed parallel beta-helix repeat-containing protein [Candidatus Thermoplasmatota archaeon]
MKLHKFVTALIALAMLLSPLLIFGTSSAGIAPPPDDLINGVQYIDGDWVISGYENYSNEIIYLTGNLTVTGTGMLAFENVTLLMNNTNSDGEHFILVQDGGTFYVNDTDGNPATTYDRSVITNSELEPYGYDFQTNATGTLEVRNSVIRRCGILTGGAGKEKSGLISHSDSTFIENTELYFNANGLVSDSAGFKMLNCSIHDNLFYGIRVLNSTSPANQVSLILSNTTINSNQDSGIYVESDFIDMSLDNNTVENNGAGGVIVTSHRNVNGTFRDNDIVNNSNEGGIGIWGSSDLCEIRVDLTGNNLSHNTGLAPLRLGFRHNEIPVHSVWVNASNNDIWGVGSYDGLVLILAVDSITANFTDNNFISPYTQNGFHLGQISKEFNVNPSTRVVRAEIHNNNISNLASGAVRVCAVKDIFCNMTGNHVYHPDGAMTCGAVTFGWFKSGLDYSTPENATINFKNNIIEGLQDTGGLGMKAIYNLNADVENNTILDTHGMGIKLGWMDDSEYTQTTKLWSRPTRNVQAKVCNNTVSGRGGPGIWLYSLSGSRVYDNTISARTGLLTRKLVGAGIRIQDTNGAAEIFNNSVSGCEAFGIQLYHSAGVSVHDNLMSANTYGMALNSFSKHNVLFNNIILKSASQYGYYLTSDSLDHAIPDNNTVNGEWLRYFYDTHGSPGTPVLIENHIIQEPLMSNLGQIILANSSYVSLQNNVAAQGMNGIYLYNVDHSMIARNDIQDNTLLATSHGLHLESNTSDNIIESNNFENNFNGIAILSNSVRNRFWYNQLNKSDTQIGLLMGTDGTVWNNDIPPNNTVCGTPVRYYFMEDGLNLADITVATPLMSNLGQFIVLDSSNLSFSNITLSKGYSGFYLANLQNATFRRLNASANNNNFYCRNSGNISIFDSKAEAGNINLELDNVQNLHADNVTQLGGTYSVRLTSSNGTILNSTLSNATLYTLNLATGSQLELVNTTFHNATLNSDSVLNVSWYLDLAVECNLQPVESANVTVTNASGFIAFDGLTAPDGTIRNIRLKEYEMTPNGTAFQTPYNLSVSQETLGDYTQSLNMSRTTHLDVTLGDLTAPEITVEPTITPGILGTSTDTAWLNVTIEDTGVCPGPIADAEWFLSTTMPQIVNGTGFPMLASDG